MTKYDDQAEQRCPNCGTPVRLTDDHCPRCEQLLYYGYNLKKDKQAVAPKLHALPIWIRILLGVAAVAVFVTAMILDSGLLFFLSLVLLAFFVIAMRSAVLGFSFFGLGGAVMSRNDLEPWDKTMYDYTEKKAQ